MSGIAAVIANDSARHTLFWSCWKHLQIPSDWRVEHLIGGDWCGARNTLAQMTLDSGADYLWFMDDDHAFQPDLLMKLLRHDLPLVVPVCLGRQAPFAPVTFTENLGTLDGYEGYERKRLALPEHSPNELVKLVAGGTAGMVIHRDVLEAVGGPHWFEYGFVSEDLLFCDKAVAAGFEIYCDLGARLGHITTAVVWPTVHDEEWTVGVTIGSQGASTNVILPIEMSPASEKVTA